jgi:Neuraminidase (sialidase)
VEDVLIVTFGADNAFPWGYLFSARSTDGGATWQDTVNITDPFRVDVWYSQANLVWNPVYEQLAVALGNGYDIIIARSDDLGLSWNYLYSAPVTDETAYNPKYADMAVGPDGTYYVTWNDGGDKDYDVFLASSSDGGDTWTATMQVNDLQPIGHQYEPHVAVDDSGRVHVAWMWGKPGESDIDLYYTYSDDGGASWLSPNILVNDVQKYVIPYTAYSLDIVADDGKAYLVWNDNRETDYGYTDIYFTRTAEVEE